MDGSPLAVVIHGAFKLRIALSEEFVLFVSGKTVYGGHTTLPTIPVNAMELLQASNTLNVMELLQASNTLNVMELLRLLIL